MIDDPANMIADERRGVGRPAAAAVAASRPAAFGTDGERLVIRTKTCAKEIAERGLGLNMHQIADRRPST